VKFLLICCQYPRTFTNISSFEFHRVELRWLHR